MPGQEAVLLQTKLHRPRLPHDLLPRARLIERLDRDLDHQLILVCGPAGFGKTTLIGAWLERTTARPEQAAISLPSAWLSLDESDNDLNLFLRYFIAALRTVFAQACDDTLDLLGARQQPPPSIICSSFINELERLPGDLVLVLDDFHTIHNTVVHQLLSELVRHWPRPLHLVLISRISPPIPLDRMRARGMLSEIRSRDLRFQPEETVAYLGQSDLAQLNPEVVPLLEERFEGWPAGLRLAVLSLRSAGSQDSILAALASENANVTGYLADEVLNHQPPPVQSFLLRTSILDRFCASLCEKLTGEPDPQWSAQACLEWVERSELFVSSLDPQHHWYRYHPLFRELLQQRLSRGMAPGRIAELRRRASLWFEAHGLVDEALQYALAADDLDLAARQMGAALRDVINREDRPTLERWLRMLPEEVIVRNPQLLMVRAWALEFSWQLKLQAQVIQQIEALLATGAGECLPPEDQQILRGQIILLKAQGAYLGNQSARAIELSQESLALLPPSWTFARGGAMMYLGMALQASGQAAAAERLLLEEYERCADKTGAYAALVLRARCFNLLNAGQLEPARRAAQLSLEGATRSGVVIMQSWAHWFLGIVSFYQHDLETAAHHFQHIADNRYASQITTYRDAVAGLALVHQLRGEAPRAWELADWMVRFDLEQSGSEDTRTGSLRARLLLLREDLEEAHRWADSLVEPPPEQVLLWLEEPQLTRARILLAGGTADDLRLARQILDRLMEIAGRTHNIRFQLEVLALRALVLEAQGEPDQAEGELERAIGLARPGRILQPFLDLGPPMQALLRRLADRGLSVEILRRILTAIESDPQQSTGPVHPVPSGPHSPGNLSLPEPLTARELEVLSLLRGPLSVKEIALQLHISPATAKRHIANVYGKLDVKQRWQAVARAEEINLLPPR